MTHNKKFIFGHHQLEDMIAQVSCAACMSHNPSGWVYAVRTAEALTCAEACSDSKLRVQDSHAAGYKTWRCKAIHMFFNRPATEDGTTPALGLKHCYYVKNGCYGGCGPSYFFFLYHKKCRTILTIYMHTHSSVLHPNRIEMYSITCAKFELDQQCIQYVSQLLIPTDLEWLSLYEG